MSVVGSQRFMQVGSRVLFKRDDDALGNKYALRDLGIVDSIAASFNKEQVDLYDTDGGKKVLVDSALSKIDEAYDVVLKNLSNRNFALALLANDPANFVQAQTEKAVLLRCFPGDLIHMLDSDAAKTRLYKLDAFGGIYTGTILNKTLTTIVAATKTITLSGDQTAVAGLAPTKSFIVQKLGLTKIANSNTYTIVTRTLNGGNTDFVVAETPAGDESAITGAIIHENAGIVYKRGVDWEIPLFGLDRALVRILSAGALSTEQDVTCVFTISAISGKRLVNPQSLLGNFKGTCEVWIGADNNDYMTVREAKVFISPNGLNLNIDDFSTITLNVKVISDITQTTPAGRLVNVKGALPNVS